MRVAIAGAGNVGRSIAAELVENEHDILLIDRDPHAIKAESLPEIPDRSLRFRLGGPGLGLNGRSSPAAAKRCAGGAGLDGTGEPQAILNRPESNSL